MLLVMSRKRWVRFLRGCWSIRRDSPVVKHAFLFICISSPSPILPPHLASAIQRTSFSHNFTSFLSIIHSVRVREAQSRHVVIVSSVCVLNEMKNEILVAGLFGSKLSNQLPLAADDVTSWKTCCAHVLGRCLILNLISSGGIVLCCHGLNLYLQAHQERKVPDPGPRNAIAAALIEMGDRVAMYVGMAVVSLVHAATL